MTNKMYDILKYLALIVFPAIGTLYFALAKIWGLPYATEIVGTIAAIDTFLGAILKISSNNYYNNDEDVDGYIDVDDSEEEWTMDLEDVDWEKIKDGSRLHLKIRSPHVDDEAEAYQGKH